MTPSPSSLHPPPREVYSKTFQPELRGLGKERRDPEMERKLWRGCPPRHQPQVTIGTEAKGCHHLNPQTRAPSPCGMLLMFCASILWVSALLHFFVTTTTHSWPRPCRVPCSPLGPGLPSSSEIQSQVLEGWWQWQGRLAGLTALWALTGLQWVCAEFFTHTRDSAARTGNYVPGWRTLFSSESVKAGPLLFLLQRLRLI